MGGVGGGYPLAPSPPAPAPAPSQVDELVAYGLPGEKAPSLKHASGVHLEADEYHRMLMEERDDTVVIDVRNAYESAIGHFAPPETGAKLIDPKMVGGWVSHRPAPCCPLV